MQRLVLIRSLFFLFLIALANSPRFAKAEFRSRESFDLGYTNNANLEKTGTDSDVFVRAATANTIRKSGAYDLGLRLSYTAYAHEKANDLLAIRLSNTWQRSIAWWKITGSLVGNFYTQGQPGTTDSSFSNVGFDIDARKDRSYPNRGELEYGGGYRFRYYTSLDGRADHNPYAMVIYERDLSSGLRGGGRSEAGLLLSGLPDYSRVYFELAGLLNWDVGWKWNWDNELGIRQSFFTSRTLSTTTTVTRNRGERIIGTRTDTETYSTVFFSSEITKRENETWRWGFGLNMASQTSKSGFQDYSVMEILARLMMNF